MSATLAGCAGNDATEIPEDATPENNSEGDEPNDEIPLPDCELNNSCSEPVIFPGCLDQEALNFDGNATEDDGSCEYEQQEPEPTYIPPCNTTASDGLNSTSNPTEWTEMQNGQWLAVDGLTDVSYASIDYDEESEIVVDHRLDWMCGYTYSVKIPPAYNSSYSYPIFLYLHGGVSDSVFFNNMLTNNFHMPEDDRYIIVRPSKLEPDWDPKKVLDVLEDVKSNLNVDDDRVYLTGLSMGGRGTFIVAAALPDYFAALMPLSPHHGPYSYLPLAEEVAHLPIWMSHGSEDNTSSYEMAAQMAENLTDLGANIIFETVVDGGHGGWFVIYIDSVAMEWMLSHVRDQ